MSADPRFAEVLRLLAAYGGAVLTWQVPEARIFIEAAQAEAIRVDEEADLYVHPAAIKVGDGAYAMPNRTQTMLEKLGFRVIDTGGGCTAWRKDFADGTYAMVTNDASHAIQDGDDLVIFFYSVDGDEWVGSMGGAQA